MNARVLSRILQECQLDVAKGVGRSVGNWGQDLIFAWADQEEDQSIWDPGANESWNWSLNGAVAAAVAETGALEIRFG